MLLAIRNYITDNNLNIGINANKTTTAYLTDEYADSAKKLKLKLVQGDDDAYDRLIEKTQPILIIMSLSITISFMIFYLHLMALILRACMTLS